MDQLLQENPNRFVLFPLVHQDLWKLYKLQVSNFWIPEEIDLSKDYKDWVQLSIPERHFLTTVLAFFAASDGIVSENLITRFCAEIQAPEARCFYAFQHAMENIHSETYANLLVHYIRDYDERQHALRAITTIPCIQEKADWALKYMACDLPFAYRVAAFAIVEGVFFSGSFCAIFWIKSRGLLPGLTYSNELISRDESLHCDFACALFTRCDAKEKPPVEFISTMMRDAVRTEKAFIDYALPENLLSMNKALMGQYIEYVADRLLLQLGYSPIFGSTNPFSFMNLSNMDGKTNFFERNVSEYRKAGLATQLFENTTVDEWACDEEI
jgi:ribonucleoside-diphosphate reductase beta chain